ncbi:hypothetical protein [Siphonobacter sp. SORGH_AS_1065]|uniref:hypothetical protein n=1 Tax=Siphonobacter sp. SORGH_AS_1065 TaxID=3041795 RepID=UPI00278B5D29|nr:hypothetical protein [Siphonobacter sp. SORGH_AS_1065]MDQ1086065.1 hypothetical protein [Siphonobacter sp. SORGH_AS_1065]
MNFKSIFLQNRLLRGSLGILFIGGIAIACQDLKDMMSLDPLKDVKFTINADPFVAPVMIKFVNANVDAVNQPTSFNVSIEGPNSSVVFMSDGSQNYKVTDGLLPLGMRSKVKPTADAPLKFTISATVPGFSPVSYNVTLTDDNASTIQIPLVEFANPAEGTSAAVVKTNLDANGSTSSTVTITAPQTATKPDVATISITPGTQMQDAAGKAVPSGQVQMNIVHYTPSSQESVVAFPGGFIADNVVDANGKPADPVTFVTAGFVAVDMFAGSTEVKKFSKPVDVKIGLDESLVNPTTGESIKAGEVVPVWSLNEETGEWKEEGTATVTAGSDGKLTAQFKAAHLSFWNLDWGFNGIRDCLRKKLTINFKSNTIKTRGNTYEVQLQTEYGAYLTGSHSQEIYDGLSFTLPRSPAYNKVKIVVYDMWGSKQIAQTNVFNPCSTDNITVNVNPPAPPAFVNLAFNFSVYSSSSKILTKPSGWVSMNKTTGNWWEPGTNVYMYVNVGNGNSQVIKNGTYNVGAYYDKKWQETLITFDPSKLPMTINDKDVKGNVTYDAGSNTITVDMVSYVK